MYHFSHIFKPVGEVLAELNEGVKIDVKATQSFEDYLKDRHASNYMGTDDDMPDASDNWMANLDIEEVIAYAEDWAKTLK